VGGETLTGTVSHVDPAIQNGVMKVWVSLDQKGSPLLRPRLRVDVDVVTARREQALRLERGPGVPPSGSGEMFVVRGGRALRTSVRIGVVGTARCEVLSGLAAGDEVIVSETSRLLQAKEISVR
jgi:HlyD family secretion protein